MSEPNKSKILFVDDDPVNRQMLTWLFEQEGYSILEASTGQEALDKAAECRPDLIVLDVNLPDKNGVEVCKQLKGQPDTHWIPILHISAVFVGSGDRSQALEEGADGYLVKPVEPREILATVKALLRVRAAEEAARGAAQQWRTTFDAISDAVSLISVDGHIVRCNRAFCQLVGRSFVEVIGQPYGVVLQEGLGLLDLPALEVFGREQGSEPHELLLGRRWFRLTADPILDGNGAWMGSVHILTDITRNKEMEDQLRQGQKLEAIGRLAGGIAHDFNNLLTAILGNTALLLRNLPPDDPEHGLVTTIERAAWRAAELTRQLLGFSRQTLLWLKTTDLNEPITETASTLQPTLPAGVQLQAERTPGLWPVQADPVQIHQVLLKLCLNAVDAMPQGGVLTLSAANVQLTEENARENPEARPGSFVRLSVQDTGVGIAAELLPRIFDPFFTTKPVGKGTGLGLAMVHGIVKQHQGWVECRSAPGQGSTFDLYLPRSAATDDKTTPTTQAPTEGSQTILLASDHDVLRNLNLIFLQQNGFRVLQAADGVEALRLFETEHATIDLVILDLTSPPLLGPEALQVLRRVAPGVRALLITPTTTSLAEANALGFSAVLARPYREAELVQAVRTALAHP